MKALLQQGGRFVARHRDNAVVRSSATFARRFLESYQNLDYDIEHNGERRVVELFGRIGADCILDVGANVGEWALVAHAAVPEAEIHCFEIVDSTAVDLARNMAGRSRIVVNPFGLSDHAGTIAVRHFPDRSALSTTVDYPQPFDAVVVQAEVRTGDEYLTSRGIERVDLLKIDVEGAEHRVLEGFCSALGEGRIRAVQFEYGAANVVERFLLKDHYELFEALGYCVGKIYPRSVDFRPYRFEHEDFRGPNYLAVAESDVEIIAVLGG